MKKWAGRLLTGMLCLMLMGGNGFALGEETAAATPTASPQTTAEVTPAPTETSEVRYTAIASVALKVRRAANDDAPGNGSIAKGDVVYIVDLGDEWSKVI